MGSYKANLNEGRLVRYLGKVDGDCCLHGHEVFLKTTSNGTTEVESL